MPRLESDRDHGPASPSGIDPPDSVADLHASVRVDGVSGIMLMGVDDVTERMLEDPVANREAAVDATIAERFMNDACGVPGWEDADPGDRPVRFMGPPQVAHELAPWPDHRLLRGRHRTA